MMITEEAYGPVPLLEVRDLSISFEQYARGLRKKTLRVVTSLWITVQPGEIVAVVGSSGSGKSLLAHAILGILPSNARVTGTMRYANEDLTPERQVALRGRDIALVPQLVSYLNPLMRVGAQVRAAVHNGNAVTAQREVFARYHLATEVERLFSFQLSGGMVCRMLVSTAVISGASLIIADEPTPGLHAAVVEETLGHLRELAEGGRAVMLITHDIEAALTVVNRIAVLYAGTTVEIAPAADFTGDGQALRHPYSRAMWRALPQNGFVATPGAQPALDALPQGCIYEPRCVRSTSDCAAARPAIRELRNGMVRCIHATWSTGGIGFRYQRGPWVLRGVDITVEPGELVGLTGPSGCGKTTLARILAGYERPLEGTIRLGGRPLPATGYNPVQLVFQHPEKAVNPRWRMRDVLIEGWEPDPELLTALNIERSWFNRWANELSGGELQRFCLARALGPQTCYLIADEITTMLDTITQAQIWHVVLDIVRKRNLGVLMISHD